MWQSWVEIFPLSSFLSSLLCPGRDFGINLKQVLTDYLTVVLIEWDSSCYQARAAAVIAHLHDLHVQLHQTLTKLLMRKVSLLGVCDVLLSERKF